MGPRSGTPLIDVKPNARAVVVLEYTGSATYADNVELVVGDGASLTSWSACRRGPMMRCTCRIIMLSSGGMPSSCILP